MFYRIRPVIGDIMCASLRKIASHNNIIPKSMCIFKHSPPLLRFAILYSHRDTRFFIEEICVKFYRRNKLTNIFRFESVKSFI
jgi:hypothetical protein